MYCKGDRKKVKMKTFNQGPNKNSLTGKDLLYINILGSFLVKHGDRDLSEKTKRSSKLWELFKFFLTHRGKNLLPETILETL